MRSWVQKRKSSPEDRAVGRAPTGRDHKQPVKAVSLNLSTSWDSALRQGHQPEKSHSEASKAPRETQVCGCPSQNLQGPILVGVAHS